MTAPEDFASTFSHLIAGLPWPVLPVSTVHTVRRPRRQRVLTARWLTGVGLVSHCLYMWHEPITPALYDAGPAHPPGPGGFPLAIVIVPLVALFAAWAGYWLIEYPGTPLGRLRPSAVILPVRMPWGPRTGAAGAELPDPPEEP